MFDGRNECKNFWKKCVENHGFFRCTAVQNTPRRKARVLSRGSSFRWVAGGDRYLNSILISTFWSLGHVTGIAAKRRSRSLNLSGIIM